MGQLISMQSLALSVLIAGIIQCTALVHLCFVSFVMHHHQFVLGLFVRRDTYEFQKIHSGCTLL